MNEKTAVGINLASENPPFICPECAASGTQYVPSGAVFVYCSHSSKGVTREPGEDWMVIEGLTQSQFTREVFAAVLKAEIIHGELALAAAKASNETMQ